MQVDRGNFRERLRDFKSALPASLFVSLDFEFTGLGDMTEQLLDSPQQRYTKARAAVARFTPVLPPITFPCC